MLARRKLLFLHVAVALGLAAGLAYAPSSSAIDLESGWWMRCGPIHTQGCFDCRSHNFGVDIDEKCWHVGDGQSGEGIKCECEYVLGAHVCQAWGGACDYVVADGGFLTADQCQAEPGEACPEGCESCQVLYK